MKTLYSHLILCVALALPQGAQAFLGKEKEAAVNQYVDTVMSLMQQAPVGFTTDTTLLLKPYISDNEPHRARQLEIFKEIDALMSAVENYSVALSTLSTTGSSESEAIDLLATALTRFYSNIPGEVQLPDPDFNARLTLIRQQKDYLDALQIAQPVITGIGRYAQDLFTEYEAEIAGLASSIDGKILEDYKGLVAFKDVIDDRRVKFLSQVDTNKPNAAGPEEAAIQQLNQLSRIMAVVQPYLKHFWDIQREMGTVVNKEYVHIAKLKLVFLIWVRAHAQLASGETDTDAFDVMEYKHLIQEAAKFGKDFQGK
jgi:hypothetical protein